MQCITLPGFLQHFQLSKLQELSFYQVPPLSSSILRLIFPYLAKLCIVNVHFLVWNKYCAWLQQNAAKYQYIYYRTVTSNVQFWNISRNKVVLWDSFHDKHPCLSWDILLCGGCDATWSLPTEGGAKLRIADAITQHSMACTNTGSFESHLKAVIIPATGRTERLEAALIWMAVDQPSSFITKTPPKQAISRVNIYGRYTSCFIKHCIRKD